jgi:hypothetical protein
MSHSWAGRALMSDIRLFRVSLCEPLAFSVSHFLIATGAGTGHVSDSYGKRSVHRLAVTRLSICGPPSDPEHDRKVDKLQEKAPPQRHVRRAWQDIQAGVLPAQLDLFEAQACRFKRPAAPAIGIVGLFVRRGSRTQRLRPYGHLNRCGVSTSAGASSSGVGERRPHGCSEARQNRVS